jgi:hypothetical protein
VGDLSNQVHDWNPGILPSGLLWTIPIDKKTIDADHSGRARFHMKNLPVPDFHDFFNAIQPNASSVPGHVSFDARWSGHAKKQKIRDTTFGFEGSYVVNDLRISFTASDDGAGVTYSSDPDGQQTASAAVGKERNGAFFQ